MRIPAGIPSRRALGAFWAVTLALLAGGAGVLEWLGPPDAPEAPAAAASTAPAAPPLVAAAPSPPAPSVPAQTVPAQSMPAPSAPTPTAPPAPQAMPTPPAPGSTAPQANSPAAIPPAAALPPAPEPPPLAASPARQAAASAVPAEAVIPPPDPLLLEPGRYGPMPRRAAEGRTAIRTYARPFDREDRRPRIGLIIGNMGAFAQHSEEAIRRLPGAVTLAFSPYAARPAPLLERARARGMEVLTALPMEPAGFGQDADPGDRALLTSLSPEENLDRMDWALSRIQGQVGVLGALSRMRGERFAASTELLSAVQQALTGRGLLYIDPRPGSPQPARAVGRTVDVLLDEPAETRGEIERRLAELEALARQSNPPSALGMIGNPTPAAIAAILAWSAGLEDRGAVIAPITVLLRRPSETTPAR